MSERAVEREVAAGSRAPSSPGEPVAVPAAHALIAQLQRTAGNAAVSALAVSLGGRARLLQRQPRRPAEPVRGRNPALDVAELNRKLRRPSSEQQARAAIDEWLAGFSKILDAATAASTGATHTSAIVANERAELVPHGLELRNALDAFKKLRGGWRDFFDAMRRFAEVKRREIDLEFRHNVVIASDAPGWLEADMSRLEVALAGMPADATWSSPHAITFTRDFAERGSVGGETSGWTITMYNRGMTSAEYKPSSHALGGLKSDIQSIRHEIGHTVEQRLPAAVKDELFGRILDWREYHVDWIRSYAYKRRAGQEVKDAPADLVREYFDLVKESRAMSNAALIEFIDRFPSPGADDLVGPTSRRDGRVYWRSTSILNSLGKPAELPAGDEFDYARTAHDEYIAELYAYAINRPAFLASRISAAQRRWWKERVFNVPDDPQELKRQASPPPGTEAALLQDADKLFTWQQIDARIAELAAAAPAAPAATPAVAPL